MPATMCGCNMFALTSWLQHVSPDEIFHKSPGTDVLGGLSPLQRGWQNEGLIGISCQKKSVMMAKLKTSPS